MGFMIIISLWSIKPQTHHQSSEIRLQKLYSQNIMLCIFLKKKFGYFNKSSLCSKPKYAHTLLHCSAAIIMSSRLFLPSLIPHFHHDHSVFCYLPTAPKPPATSTKIGRSARRRKKKLREGFVNVDEDGSDQEEETLPFIHSIAIMR